MTTDLQAIDLPFEQAIAFFRQKVNVKTHRWTDVWREAHSRAFMVAGAATDALVQDFREAVDKAISQGTTLEEFRRDFDTIVKKHGWEYNGGPGWRSRVIYETNLAGAYSAGRYAQMNDPDVREMYPYWMYKHGGSVHPRLQHLAWDGLTLRCDDAFWDSHYPPNGWRCSCYVIPQSEATLARRGKDGPDTAPPIEMRTWVDKATGARHQVPVGIDPGFDYNPGKAWLQSPVKSDPMRPARGENPDPDFKPIQTHDLAAADAELNARQAPWGEKLAPNQKEALEAYKGLDGLAMNLQARGDISIPRLADKVQTLQDAMGAAQAPADMLVYRGIGEAEAKLYRGMKSGDSLKARAFVSTSLSEGIAGSLAPEENGTVIELVIRKGTNGVAYVHPFPRYRFRQYEVLINRGAVLKILRADDDVIRLEVGTDDD